MIEQKDITFRSNVTDRCIKGKTYIIPGSIENGHNCGYSLFIPENCQKNITLLVHSCNTGNKVPVHLDEANIIVKESTYNLNFGIWLAYDLKMPVLIPHFPRIEGYYTQAWGSQVIHNDISTLLKDQARRNENEKLSAEEITRVQMQCKDIPNQLVNMINSAKAFAKEMDITLDDKVIIEGYSAGSHAANYFTALHPEIVKACICGGNNGLGIIPLSEYEGEQINYPIGVADIPNFDFESFRKIPQLYYIGTEDYNDPAMYKCKFQKDENNEFLLDEEGYRIPITDANGRIIPVLDDRGRLQPRYIENYTQREIEQIHSLIGSDTQTRFYNSEKIYSQLGINASFHRLPGTHKTVTQKHDGNYNYSVNELIVEFINNILKQELSSPKR